MKKLLLTTLASLLMIGLIGCSNVPREDVGLVAGGAAGAGVGALVTDSSPVGVGVGAVGGALLGKKLTEDKDN